jgi:NAD-dependent deacetylase
MRSSSDPNLVLECKNDIKLGDLASDGSQLRPQIVWFNEEVPLLETAIDIVKKADILVIVGTSMQVYPAASLINYVKKNSRVYIIDPHIPNLSSNYDIVKIEEIASVGMLKLSKILNPVV